MQIAQTIGLVALVTIGGVALALGGRALNSAVDSVSDRAARQLRDALSPRQRQFLRSIFGTTVERGDLDEQLAAARTALSDASVLLQRLQDELAAQERARGKLVESIERDRELAQLTSDEARAVRSLVSGGERRSLWVNTLVNVVAFVLGVAACHFWA